ncbi:hypothetical protein PTI98_002318 [Pleurotus ostreatus]|nr:hypothetical protein PTI98_002318 [Pleurotus ostreatus]
MIVRGPTKIRRSSTKVDCSTSPVPAAAPNYGHGRQPYQIHHTSMKVDRATQNASSIRSEENDIFDAWIDINHHMRVIHPTFPMIHAIKYAPFKPPLSLKEERQCGTSAAIQDARVLLTAVAADLRITLLGLSCLRIPQYR